MEAPGGRRLVLDGLAEFAEHLGGELTVTMLEAIGKGVEVHEVREEVVLHVVDRLREMQPVR
jgi:3-dehydroquinate synthase